MGVNSRAQAALDALFSSYGSSVPVISAYRDPKHNADVGGAKNSQHIHGNAFDLDVSHMPYDERLRLAELARGAGFNGFGFYGNSMHFDIGPARYWGPSYGAESTPDWAMGWVRQHFGDDAVGGGGGGSYAGGGGPDMPPLPPLPPYARNLKSMARQQQAYDGQGVFLPDQNMELFSLPEAHSLAMYQRRGQ